MSASGEGWVCGNRVHTVVWNNACSQLLTINPDYRRTILECDIVLGYCLEGSALFEVSHVTLFCKGKTEKSSVRPRLHIPKA